MLCCVALCHCGRADRAALAAARFDSWRAGGRAGPGGYPDVVNGSMPLVGVTQYSTGGCVDEYEQKYAVVLGPLAGYPDGSSKPPLEFVGCET